MFDFNLFDWRQIVVGLVLAMWFVIILHETRGLIRVVLGTALAIFGAFTGLRFVIQGGSVALGVTIIDLWAAAAAILWCRTIVQDFESWLVEAGQRRAEARLARADAMWMDSEPADGQPRNMSEEELEEYYQDPSCPDQCGECWLCRTDESERADWFRIVSNDDHIHWILGRDEAEARDEYWCGRADNAWNIIYDIRKGTEEEMRWEVENYDATNWSW